MKRAIGLALSLVLCAVWLSGCSSASNVDQNSQDTSSADSPQQDGELSMSATRGDKSGLRLAPEIQSTQWLNGAPVTLQDLRGRVVMIDFWTFDCINCQHVIPALKGWHEKYGSQGLTIIGVHTPEFDFERQTANVADAIRRFGLPYRVALDNDMQNWNNYRNHYWPSYYLIDRAGYIRYNHIGEGNEQQVESVIQQLLAE